MASDESLSHDELYSEYEARARARRERRRRDPPPRRGPRPSEARHLAGTPGGRLLIGAFLTLALATLVGLIALWPHGAQHRGPSQALGGPSVAATVEAVRDVRCPGPTPQRCRQLTIAVAGRSSVLTLGPVNASPDVAKGEDIRVSRVSLPPGVKAQPGVEPYSFQDVDRHGSLLLLAILFGVLALLVLWWRGLLAVLGVGLSLLLLATFVVPAILAGHPALLVALVGALAVMFVTVLLTNGLGAQALAAALGIAASLGLTSLLALVCVHLVHLDGKGSEFALALGQQAQTLSLQGVVLAGMVIGALGVLADTAVTQASAVMALRRANAALDPRQLYRGALTVGRDHLSATIHTLVLAYAGTALPLLLVMRSSGVNVTDALNNQDIAAAVVAAVVGCIGLIAALPLTTGLAALLVSRVPAEALPDSHAHAH